VITNNLRENIPEKFLNGEVPSYSKMNYLVYIINKIIDFCKGHGHTGGFDGEIITKNSIDTTSFGPGGPGLIPVGAVIIWTGNTCPTGFTVASTSGNPWGSAYNGAAPTTTGLRYLKAKTGSVGEFTGTRTHYHPIPTHTHSFISNEGSENHKHQVDITSWKPILSTSSGTVHYSADGYHYHVWVLMSSISGRSHTHTVTSQMIDTNTSTADTDLNAISVLFCRKD